MRSGLKTWTSTKNSSPASPFRAWSAVQVAGRVAVGPSARRRAVARPARRALRAASASKPGGRHSRGLAHERERAARNEHALNSGERAVEIGEVVEDGVAKDEVEGVVLERELAPRRPGRSRPRGRAVARSRRALQHSGRDVGRRCLLDHSRRARGSARSSRCRRRSRARARSGPALLRAPLRASSGPVAPRSGRSRCPICCRSSRPRVVVARVDVLDLVRSAMAERMAAMNSRDPSARAKLCRSRAFDPANADAQQLPNPARSATRRAGARAHGRATLPDVPEENYWYRRHLAVYRWIAERCRGMRVVDMACGEGYGSAILAERAAVVCRRRCQPGGARACAPQVPRPNLRSERALVEKFDEEAPYDAIVFLQTIEHVERPVRSARAVRLAARAGRGRLRQHAEPPHAGAAGSEPLRQSLASARVRPGRVPGAGGAAFKAVELLGVLPRAQAAPARSRNAARLGPSSSCPPADRALLRRFVPAIDEQGLRDPRRSGSSARSTFSRSVADERPARDGRARDRPPQPHALRGGVRDLAVRRGMAARGDRERLPAAASSLRAWGSAGGSEVRRSA